MLSQRQVQAAEDKRWKGPLIWGITVREKLRCAERTTMRPPLPICAACVSDGFSGRDDGGPLDPARGNGEFIRACSQGRGN